MSSEIVPDSFEELSESNGSQFWRASILAQFLGYAKTRSFRKVVEKAMGVCTSLGIPVRGEIEEFDDSGVIDWKLSRFACYLCAMNGDPRKPEVAKAQAFFASMADNLQQYIQNAEDVERTFIRDEVKEGAKLMASTGKAAGVTYYGRFQNAGYLGMYNMSFAKLRKQKGVPVGRTPLDFMGRTELAANLFRITQTEEKIKRDSVRGQNACEGAAKSVGREVRATMIRVGGSPPESLPPGEDIKKVRTGIKKARRALSKIDTRELPTGDSSESDPES